MTTRHERRKESQMWVNQVGSEINIDLLKFRTTHLP